MAMKWYEKKFREFFKEYDRGDLYLKGGQSYFGTVKELALDEDFGESTIRFEYTKEGDKSLPKSKEGSFSLKDVRHFRATDGSILNIQRYLGIVEVEKERVREREKIAEMKAEEEVEKVGEVEEIKEEKEAEEAKEVKEGERELVCIAIGLEFYAPKKMANLLKANVKDVLFSQLKGVPVLMVKEQPVVELTPTFSRWVKTIKVSLAPKGKRGKR
jgi:hypothetical protein